MMFPSYPSSFCFCIFSLFAVGKQAFKVLLRTKRDMWSPPAPADWLHGIPSRKGGESRRSLPGKSRHGGWNGLGLKSLDGLSRPYPCIRVGQVGGGGSSCSETVGSELPSWAAEIQAGDHYNPGYGWEYHARQLGKVD